MKNQIAARSPLLFPLQRDGEEKWTKSQTCGLRQRRFNKATKDFIMLILLLLPPPIMDMQNKLYITQFSHCPITDSQAVPQQPSRDSELADFVNFVNFPKKTKLLEKFELPEERRFELTAKKNIPAPQPTPIPKLSMPSMVRNISMGQLGPPAWLCSLPAPEHLLIT